MEAFKLKSSLKILSWWGNKIWGKRKSQGGCIYDIKDLWPTSIKGDNIFEEISEQKIIYSETRGACVDTIFCKNRSKGIRRSR
jgi:hypothetical protein